MQITRRSFAWNAAAAVAVRPHLLLAGEMASSPNGVALSLSTGWQLFREGKLMEDKVTLPHTVTKLSWHDWRPGSWESVWSYRTRFHVPKQMRGRRLRLHVERALTNARVLVNGREIRSHRGGFLPFACEITNAVIPGENQLEIEVDARWLNVPPAGSPKGPPAVDYYLPGGLTGSVTLEELPPVAIEGVWARPRDVLSGGPSLDLTVSVNAEAKQQARLKAQLYDDTALIAEAAIDRALDSGVQTVDMALLSLQGIALWGPEHPKLYQLKVTATSGARSQHQRSTRIGFREAAFALDGFYLNGRKLRLFGLNRHELFPYTGFAASPRTMRRDAHYLRHVLNCNVVRCSHYPQSQAFLDACDEVGLMVWEETPGWQYLGDAAWRELAIENVADMVRRDRNRPSIIVWGTRINESPNDPELYKLTHEVAKRLDPTRPTSGSMTPSSRADWKERWREDIFAFDDYHAAADGSVGIEPPVEGYPYMLAEAVGQYSYDTAKNFLRKYRRAGKPEEQNAQAIAHAQAHDRAAAYPRNAGVIAWCAFDYASPMNSHRGVKCPGVVDSFRIPKAGASFYMAQVDPGMRIVLEPSFYWDADLYASSGSAAIFSNCDELSVSLDDRQIAVITPDRAGYPNLRYPPFPVVLPWDAAQRSVLKIDGFLKGRQVASRSFQGSRDEDRLWISADDHEIDADGVDATRIAFGVSDKFGNLRPSAHGSITVQLTGPAVLIGDTEFNLSDTGAVGAVWVRSLIHRPGEVEVRIHHASLGTKSVSVSSRLPPRKISAGSYVKGQRSDGQRTRVQ